MQGILSQGRSQPFFPLKSGPRCKAKIAYINFR